MNDNDNSRRKFLATGILATLAVAGCAPKKNPFAIEGEENLTGEKVKLLSVDGEVIEMDKAFLRPVSDIPKPSNNEERRGIAGKKFVMVIDLSRCKNLRKCQSSCNHVHHVHSDLNWLKVYPMNEGEHTAPY